MTARSLLTARQVAAKLGHSVDWFYRNAKHLVDFPFPINHCGRRWDPAAIDDWLDRQGDRDETTEHKADRTNVVNLEFELARRARALNAGGKR